MKKMQAESIELRVVGRSTLRQRRGALGLLLGLSLLASTTGAGGAGLVSNWRPPSVVAPATLISGVTPTSIVVTDTNAYFTNAYGLVNELDQVPITGGVKTVLATSMTSMASLLRFGNTLFWSDTSGYSTDPDAGVWDLALSGGAPTQISYLASDTISNQALAVYAVGTTLLTMRIHVLHADPLAAKLYDTRLSIFGHSEVSLLPDVDPVTMLNYYPFSLVLDATNVYFTHDSGDGVFVAPLSGGPATLLVAGVTRTALAMDGSTLFFQQGNDINEVSATGGAVSTFAAGAGTVSAMVAQSGVVYWACGACGTVVKKPVAGSISTLLASGQQNPSSLAIDGGHVYFGTATALKRVAK